MRMKFREIISKILTGGWWDGILAGETDKLSSYKMTRNTQHSIDNQKIVASS